MLGVPVDRSRRWARRRSLGAAILAAAGVGAVPGLAAGVASMTGVARRLEPDPAVRDVYDAGFDRYRALYPALRSAGIGGYEVRASGASGRGCTAGLGGRQPRI